MTARVNRPLMIIDDDDDLRTVLALIMTAQGYEVAAYGNARKALGALQADCAPFLILLDLMMAGMSGWEFRTAQLGDPRLAPIPVVVLTAVSSPGDDSSALSNVEVLEKPFDLDSLLAVVRRYAAVPEAQA